MSNIHRLLARRQEELAKGKSLPVEHIPLLLLSSIPAPLHIELKQPHLLDCEFRLRRVCAHEALEELCRTLCITAHVFGFQYCRSLGQREGTRMDSIKKANEHRTNLYAETYRRHCNALLAIDPLHDAWQTELLELKPSDMKPLWTAWTDDITQEQMKQRSKNRAVR